MNPIAPVAFIAIVFALLIVYRWMARRSPVLATIFAAGVVIRAAFGLFLFWTSFLGLPFFRSLQMGGGFWTLAIDARWYFNAAATAAQTHLATIASGDPSPMYLRALALSMKILGVSPASGMLLNLILYAITAWLIVASSRRERAAAIALGVITFSPALLIFGTQPLKDLMNVTFIAVALMGIRIWTTGLSGASSGRMRAAGGAILLAISVYTIGGIRPYFAVYIILAFVAAGIVQTLGAASRRLRVAVLYIALMPVLWVAFAEGAGAYHPYYQRMIIAVLSNPTRPFEALRDSRMAFIATGGGTALGDPVFYPSESGPLSQIVTGSAAVFIPVSLLRAASLVRFEGGRGLLVITDLDTIVMDVALVASFWLLVRNSHPAVDAPVLAFILLLSVVTAITLAYVVTNFGTLFRLRLLAVTPMWIAPAFIGDVKTRANQFEWT